MEISINNIIQDVDNWTSYSSNRDSLVLLSDTKLLKCNLHYSNNSLVSALLKAMLRNKDLKDIIFKAVTDYVVITKNSNYK